MTFGAGAEPGTFINQVCGQPGDSGAPVTVNGQLVGMIHGAATTLPVCVIKYIPLHTPTTTYSINTVLADINAKNRTAGVGFTRSASSYASTRRIVMRFASKARKTRRVDAVWGTAATCWP